MTPDPRAGTLCCSCNAKKPLSTTNHCRSPHCPWWVCGRCASLNDRLGHVILPPGKRPQP